MSIYDFKKNKVYRSREGMILGICKGLAIHYDIPVFWMRIGMGFTAMVTSGWAILVYFGLAMIMRPMPILPLSNEDENEFYDSYTSSRSMALHRLKRKFDGLNDRIHRMEDVVTSKDYQWQQRFPEDAS